LTLLLSPSEMEREKQGYGEQMDRGFVGDFPQKKKG
jgi:hypothetical protein